MKRETPNQKLRRELSDVRQQLFKVCTEPDSSEAKSIIMHQKNIQYHKGRNPMGFYNTLKELGLGRMPEKPFEHYETERK